MSNRFYVNDVQIFGNNEMFKNTYTELEKQGAEWTDDCTFNAIEIKDPQGLMDAVEKDSLEYLKKCLTEENFDHRKMKFIKRPFSRITDKHLLLSSWNKEVVYRAYCRGKVRKNVWLSLKWWFEEKRIFTSLNLYYAIQSEVELNNDGKLELKKDGKIIACMY